jgi:hypothetical protein
LRSREDLKRTEELITLPLISHLLTLTISRKVRILMLKSTTWTRVRPSTADSNRTLFLRAATNHGKIQVAINR